MAEGLATPSITQLEFTERDFPFAFKIARRLGYTQFPYTSTSQLWGLFCLPENPTGVPTTRAQYPPYRGGAVIKTKELGFLFIQDSEDLGFGPNFGRKR
jgi:hypothetical protein